MEVDMADMRELYDNSLSIKDMKPQDTEEYHLFNVEDGSLPAKVFSPKKHLDHLPLCNELYGFFQRIRAAWIIPVELPNGRIVGYVMRDFHSSAYRTIGPEYGFQLIYGWHYLKHYDDSSPIILTEGIKDVKALRLAYPFVLGALSNGLPLNGLKVLSAITNHVVLAFDNDSGGRRLLEQTEAKLKERACWVTQLLPPIEGWDWAKSVFQPEVLERLKMSVPTIQSTT